MYDEYQETITLDGEEYPVHLGIYAMKQITALFGGLGEAGTKLLSEYTYISGVYWSDGDIYCTNQSNRSLLYKVTADGSTPQLKTINADIFDSFHPQLGLVRTGQIWCKLSDVWTNGAFTPAYYISDEHPFTNGIRIPAPTTFLKDIGNFLIYSDAATMYSQPKWLGNVSSVALLPEPITKTNQQSMQVTYRLTVDFSGN
ncbi:hypothetical protein FACS189425_04840 [Clostridia bacterium]|nr:hypothetical protein FACS189425_04840 [Clostridia bacterium]